MGLRERSDVRARLTNPSGFRWLTAEGYGFGGEGDWKRLAYANAVSMRRPEIAE